MWSNADVDHQIDLPSSSIDVEHWYATRAELMKTAHGRSIYEGVQNLVIDDYVIRKVDVADMAKSYVADIVEYIDVANKENTRILASSTLL